ncbi:MAG TPA: nucleotidyltransferase domain-containing protein [Chitinophagales bacterium]|nr:nucleotidyltransferase domain-containing protein [Chitinophagales bacterium]
MNIVEQHRKEIELLCETHMVDSLFVFGSVLTDKFDNKSDVDFLVVFGQVDLNNYADNYFDFVEALEKLLGRKVDLVSEKKLVNPYLIKSINRNRIKIYERRNPGLAA